MNDSANNTVLASGQPGVPGREREATGDLVRLQGKWIPTMMYGNDQVLSRRVDAHIARWIFWANHRKNAGNPPFLVVQIAGPQWFGGDLGSSPCVSGILPS